MKKTFFCLVASVLFFGFFNQALKSEEAAQQSPQGATPPATPASTPAQPATPTPPAEVVPPPPAPAPAAVEPAAAPSVQPAAQTAVEPAAAAIGAGKNMELKPVTPTPSEPKSESVKETSSGTPEPKPVPKSEPAPAQVVPVGFVAPLSELVRFYEEEVASAKKLIEQWNERVRSYVEREKGLAAEKDKFDKQLSEKSAQDPKGNKREIMQIKKQIKRLDKDLKTVQKDIDNLKRDLITELREMGNFAGKTIGEKFSQVKEKVKAFGQEIKE